MMITVKDLIAELQNCNPDAVVIMQRDPEGNGYAPCAGADGNVNWNSIDRECGYATLTPELINQGFTDEDLQGGDPAVVLWPVW